MTRRFFSTFISTTVLLLPPSFETRLQASGGVRFSYSLPQTLTLHEPVRLVSTISNESSEPARLDLGQDRKGGYVLVLTLPNGVKIDLPQHSREGIARLGTLALEPGQTYSQTLLLNEWYSFETPGRYQLQIRASRPALVGASSTPVADPGFEAAFEIQSRNTERLEATLSELIHRIEDSTSYEQAAEAATALRYVADPLAVLYLEKALRAGKGVEPIAVAGLEGIANQAAVAALITSLQSDSPDVPTLARSALQRIQQRTPDSALKEQIGIALRAPSP